MNKIIIVCALVILAGCSTISAIPTAGTTEERVIAACAIERVRERLPTLCADPVATARNIELAKRVLRVLVDLAL